ncbi:hypothetical protein OS493_037509 [Desmophyllum pertusum]|uniref:EGF-like domain-containing protein n=1 Tax=Desmophyllum pertusum TaxID=174260 RepID=A0A9W9Y746_9CNID|nr:hypothetical protein OS493_037509 [Desmophyllum pertusum]
MDVCRYFEVGCDNELEDCQLIYLNKWLLAPGQYKCSCKKGFKRHPTKTCIALKPTNLPSAQPTEKKQLKATEKKLTNGEMTKQKESKSNIGVILGSLSACLVVITVVAFVLWKNFPKRMTSEERLRREVIVEMEETWIDENAEAQEQTLLTKISNQLQSLSAKFKSYFADLTQKLRDLTSNYKRTERLTRRPPSKRPRQRF